MEKRVFLAIFLSFGILVLYQTYVVPPPPPPTSVPVMGSEGAAATSTAPASATPGPAALSEPTAATDVPATPQDTTPAREIVVDTDHVRVVFTTEGAAVTSWRLKRYFDSRGEPLELVPAQLPAGSARPFTLATDQDALSARLASVKFSSATEGTLSLGSAPGTLSFEFADPSTGLIARKSFHFQPDGLPYNVTIDASVDVRGVARPVTLKMGPSLGLGFGLGSSMMPSYPPAAIYHRDNSVERLSPDDITAQPAHEGVMRFVGVGDHYFLSAALPGTRSVRVEYRPLLLPVPEPDATETGVTERIFVDYSIVTSGALSLPFYVGPKDFDILRAVDGQLVRAIDFGMLSWLVVPLLQALKWINGYLGNFGWSIIALTILLNIIMFPLRHKSMVSMRKMQEVQPEVKAIQERYKKYKMTDPERQKMNTEMMALYKQKGVNPASGCVPMLLTFPVLFAFYAMLSVAIELRGAPWVGWISDLSVMDPLYITPVLMGASMFWQQRLTPTTADPIQQKMFLFMPVIFSVMFLWAPAGLVLYWLSSNMMTIGQQYLTNHLIGAPPKSTGGTSAERRAKAVGSASTVK